MKRKIYLFIILFLIIPQLLFAATSVFYSLSPYGTGDIKTGSPTITISSGIATLSVAQTGNIGVGCCIDYDPNNTLSYIAPNRLGFDSGGTTELKVDTKIEGGTSGATGIVRAIEVTSGTWAGGDAAGWIYLSISRGTWQDDEQINRIEPSTSSDIATVNGTLNGNMGNGNTQFVVKTAVGADAANVGSAETINSIHHEYASFTGFEAGFTDASHINDTDLTNVGVIVHACCYYDHDDDTKDITTTLINFGTSDENNYLFVYASIGFNESINNQRHSGKWSTDSYRKDVIAGVPISSNDSFVRIYGLQLKSADNHSIQINVSSPPNNGRVYIAYNILRPANVSSKSGVYFFSAVSGHKAFAWNNIIYDGDQGLYWNDADWTIFAYNNTIIDCAVGLNRSNDTAHYCFNNLIDCSNAFLGTFTDNDNNNDYNIISENIDDPACGSHGGYNKTFIFKNESGDDFHLSGGDSTATGKGVDLSSNSNLEVWDDIDGDDRIPTWGVGADDSAPNEQLIIIGK